jgi:DNA-binding CsgD family transcriptional regulator
MFPCSLSRKIYFTEEDAIARIEEEEPHTMLGAFKMSLLAFVQKIESALNSKEMKAFEKQVNAFVHKLNQIDWQKAEEHFKINADISESILAELDRKEIDSSVLDGIRFPEVVELYVLSTQQNLPFGDLLEDSLLLFNEVDYDASKTYLSLLDKRRDRTMDDLKKVQLPAGLLVKLKNHDAYIKELFQVAVKNYTEGKISLSETERKILQAFKKNRWLTNKALAEQLNYSERTVEANCAKIRERFGLDYLTDKNSKRRVVIDLAPFLTLD